MNPPREGTLHETLVATPVGDAWAVAADEGLCLLRFADACDRNAERAALSGALGRPMDTGAHPLLDRVRHQLDLYFAGALRSFDVPLLLPGTSFEQRVWAVLRAIPYGDTRSYARVASDAGCPGGARATGGANARNRIAILVPCHRVIPSAGGPGGYNGGAWRKRWLLALESRGAPPPPCAS